MNEEIKAGHYVESPGQPEATPPEDDEDDDAPMPSRPPSELFKFASSLARAHAELAIEAVRI